MSFRPHNEECRSRIEAALKAEDNQRWNRASDKKEEVFWNKVREEEDRMKESEKRKIDQEEDAGGKRKKNEDTPVDQDDEVKEGLQAAGLIEEESLRTAG